MDELIKLITPEAVLLALAIVALFLLLVPLVLRLAGLTGEQVSMVLSETMRFFLALVDELRQQNKNP
jgi:hypothetical protein